MRKHHIVVHGCPGNQLLCSQLADVSRMLRVFSSGEVFWGEMVLSDGLVKQVIPNCEEHLRVQNRRG